MKKYKTIIIELGVLLYLVVALGFVSREQSQMRCSGVEVSIENKDGNYFIEEQDIERIIKNKSRASDSILLDSINVLLLEEAIKKHPSVEDVNVFTRVNGTLSATVTQRKPVARVFNNRGQSFYIDDKGKLMPLSQRYTSRVMVVTGDILFNLKDSAIKDSLTKKDKIARTQLKEVFSMVQYIYTNEFLHALIEQVYVDEKGSYTLVPKVGPKHIVFGDLREREKKFRKLEIFYKKGLNATNWQKYSRLNLKYKDQVVCTKI